MNLDAQLKYFKSGDEVEFTSCRKDRLCNTCGMCRFSIARKDKYIGKVQSARVAWSSRETNHVHVIVEIERITTALDFDSILNTHHRKYIDRMISV